MALVEEYFEGIASAYAEHGVDFLKVVEGASTEELQALQAAYPDTPKSLLQILSRVNGTYYCTYGVRDWSDKLFKGHELCWYMFDGELSHGEISYYLDSVKTMLERQKSNTASLEYMFDDFVDEVVGPGIDRKALLSDRLHFADCLNNGGSSQLFVDFSPAEGGTKGQIIRFEHDPDAYVVVAESFDEFLQQQVERGFEFIEMDDDVERQVRFEEKRQSMIPLYQRLLDNDTAALQQLRNLSATCEITDVIAEVPTAAVLRVFMDALRKLYAIRHEEAPSGYTYEPQYSWRVERFLQYRHLWQADAALAEEVQAFAKEVDNEPLLAFFAHK